MLVKEAENLELSVKINKPVDDVKSLVLYKDGKKIPLNDKLSLKLDNDGNECKITLNLTDAKPSNTGDYKLCLSESVKGKSTETELAKTHLIVEATPIEVVGKLKSNKTEYIIGEDISLTFTLSKTLTNKEKCQQWTLNGKPVDLKSKQLKLDEIDGGKEAGVTYTLVIVSCELNKNDGEYTVKLRSNQDDFKSEFYSASITIKIIDDSLKVLDSNWKPEVKLTETQDIDFYVVVNKQPLDSDLTLYKDEKKMPLSNENIQVLVEKLDEKYKITFKVKNALVSNSGAYKLCLAETVKSKPLETELAKTKLLVEAKPTEVLAQLKSSQPDYTVGEEISLSFTLSKPLSDINKCQQWTLNGKPLDFKSKQAKLDQSPDNTYTLTLKASEVGKHEFTVKLRSESDNVKSEFYSSKVTVKVTLPSLKIIENIAVTPTKTPIEEQTVTFIVRFSRPLSDTETLAWLKNDKPVGAKAKIVNRFVTEDNFFETKLVIENIGLNDSGTYHLEVNESLKSDPIDLKVQEQKDDGSKASVKDEGALVELVIYDLKQKKELARQSLQFEVRLKLVSDLRPAKSSFSEDTPVELTCELNKKPFKLVVLKSPSQPVKVAEFVSIGETEKLTALDGKCELDLVKSVDCYKLKFRLNNAQPDDSAKYWLEVDEGELKTNEVTVNVKETELEFVESIRTGNKNPVEDIEHIEIEFKLNKRVLATQLLESEAVTVVFNKTRS
ncbi:unnamed protein product [Sphagnum balticum]